MHSDSSNDNGAGQAAHAPDAHGQAALLLVESLVHGLIARDLISVSDAVEIVEVAAEVKADVGNDVGESGAHQRKSLGLLNAISSSLRRDLPNP